MSSSLLYPHYQYRHYYQPSASQRPVHCENLDVKNCCIIFKGPTKEHKKDCLQFMFKYIELIKIDQRKVNYLPISPNFIIKFSVEE